MVDPTSTKSREAGTKSKDHTMESAVASMEFVDMEMESVVVGTVFLEMEMEFVDMEMEFAVVGTKLEEMEMEFAVMQITSVGMEIKSAAEIVIIHIIIILICQKHR